MAVDKDKAYAIYQNVKNEIEALQRAGRGHAPSAETIARWSGYLVQAKQAAPDVAADRWPAELSANPAPFDAEMFLKAIETVLAPSPFGMRIVRG